MRVVIQRVSSAHLNINNQTYTSIGSGMVVLIGIEDQDGNSDIEWLVHKITSLRIFGDNEGKMNLSLREINGEILVVSQFTLHASTRKGNRPSFIAAAKPDKAVPLYERFIEVLSGISGVRVTSGIFGADMQVHLVNDGPVTILMDSKQKE